MYKWTVDSCSRFVHLYSRLRYFVEASEIHTVQETVRTRHNDILVKGRLVNGNQVGKNSTDYFTRGGPASHARVSRRSLLWKSEIAEKTKQFLSSCGEGKQWEVLRYRKGGQNAAKNHLLNFALSQGAIIFRNIFTELALMSTEMDRSHLDTGWNQKSPPN